MNRLIKITAIALAGGGLYYLLSRDRTGKRASVSIIHLDPPIISGGKILLKGTVAIDNPTSGSPVIKTPSLKIYYNGNEVGNSIPDARTHTILPNDRTEIKDVNVQLPLSNLPGIFINLVSGNNTKINFTVEVNVTIDGIPYTHRQEFTKELKKKK